MEFWKDVLSFLIPALLSILVILIRHWYVIRQEAKSLKLALFHAFQNEVEEIPSVLNELTMISRVYSNHKVRITSFHVSQSQIEVSNRLIHIEPTNSLYYFTYIDSAELCSKGFISLNKLIFEKLKTPKGESDDICKAIRFQCASLQKDIVEMLRSQLEVLIMIRKDEAFLDQKQVDEFRVKFRKAQEILLSTLS